jgi:hypothetical protein
VFSKANVKSLFQPYTLVQLYTDKVPAEFYAPEVRAQLAKETSRQIMDAKEVNLPFQRDTFGTEQLPLYVILEPLLDGNIRVLAHYDEGKINDVEGFTRFLRTPHESEGGARAQLGAN